MTIRPIALPNDFDTLESMITESFQYPDNPDWRIQPDYIAALKRNAVAYKRIWPVARFIPGFRDWVRGFIFQKAGEEAGFIILQKVGMYMWRIHYLGVLPSHRQKGIGSALIAAALDYIRTESGQVVHLDVIDGNTPAMNLYTKAGFVPYAASLGFAYASSGTSQLAEKIRLPDKFVQVKDGDWRIDHELEKRIVPLEVQRFEPIDPSRYKGSVPPLVGRVFRRLSGVKSQSIAIFNEYQIPIGRAAILIRKGDVPNSFTVRGVQDDSIARYLIAYLLIASTLNGQSTRFALPNWQDKFIEIAHEYGCQQLSKTFRLGQIL
jgi:ribosomal protein S18 acetylase RimI-like enzyme